MVINVVSAVFGLIALVFASTFLFLKAKQHYGLSSVSSTTNLTRDLISKCQTNPITLTLIFGEVTAIFTILSCIASLTFNSGFPAMFVLATVTGNRNVKIVPPPLQTANIIFTALAFCCSACTTNVIPFTWVSATQQSLNAKQ